MILIDANQLMIFAITADNSKMMLDENLVRHSTLNTLRFYRKKFFREYGEIVLCFDSRNSWRKDFFPHYKANRKKTREDSSMDWEAIFKYMSIIKEEMREIFPYKIIEVDRCEGDDVIAVLSKWSIENVFKKDSMFDNDPEPVLIVSADEDFLQLHNQHVRQFSLRTKKFLTLTKSKEENLHEHIIKGDPSDGVPNVLSDDDCFVAGKRQKSIYVTKMAEWFKELPTDEQFKKNYARNKQLVDLSQIPVEYKEKIINTYTEYVPKSRVKLMNYFIKNRLTNLMDSLQDF